MFLFYNEIKRRELFEEASFQVVEKIKEPFVLGEKGGSKRDKFYALARTVSGKTL